MKRRTIFLIFMFISQIQGMVSAQEDDLKLKFSGYLLTDQRFLLKAPNSWAWNENRLNFNLDEKFRNDKGKFHTEVWVRNLGLSDVYSGADLYNKGFVDPVTFEIREAYVQLYGFLSKNLDLKIGRQRIAWGTADMVNPTDNLNPYDLEDILDFSRHRGSDAINIEYYFNSDFSLQGIYIPLFQPANLPAGIFANALSPEPQLPPPYSLEEFNENISMPDFTLGESSTYGLKFKGFVSGIDFSVSYVWGRDGFPMPELTTITAGQNPGGLNVDVNSTFFRQSIFGADMATSIGGVGFRAEVAAFLPREEVVMTTDLTAIIPGLKMDSTMLKKEAFVKFVVGGDYNFANGMYLNFQYLHGFVGERGRENLYDYFFTQYSMKFFDDRLELSPLSGAFIVSDWSDIPNNYAVIFAPGFSFMATDNLKIELSTPLFFGKGDSMFAGLTDYNMFMFKLKYNF